MTRIKLKYSLTSIIWRSETILSIGTGDRNGFRNLERKNLKRKHSFEEIHFKILSNYRSSSSTTYLHYWPYDMILFRIFHFIEINITFNGRTVSIMVNHWFVIPPVQPNSVHFQFRLRFQTFPHAWPPVLPSYAILFYFSSYILMCLKRWIISLWSSRSTSVAFKTGPYVIHSPK